MTSYEKYEHIKLYELTLSIWRLVVAHQISLQTEYVAGFVAALPRASHLALIPTEAAMRERAGV